MKIYHIALSFFCVLIFVGCLGPNAYKSSSQETMDADDIGLRKTTLENESQLNLLDINYDLEPAGASKNIERSFENAPPLIPHDIEDMYPLTTDNNMCTACHLPEFAKDAEATSMPKSHFFSARTGKDLHGKMDEERFNCNQCHVTQANVKPLVRNNFTKEFRNTKDKQQSNLYDILNEGIK